VTSGARTRGSQVLLPEIRRRDNRERGAVSAGDVHMIGGVFRATARNGYTDFGAKATPVLFSPGALFGRA